MTGALGPRRRAPRAAARWPGALPGFALALALAAPPAPAAAAAEARAAAPRPWPHEGGDLVPYRGARLGRLGNGMRYAILANPIPTGRVSLRLAVLAGTLHEEPAERGYAHLLEHLAFRATRRFADGEIRAHLRRAGAAEGPDVNARTAYDHTLYRVDLPAAGGEDLERTLAWLRDVVDGPALEPAGLEAEKRVVLAEIRDRDDANARALAAEADLVAGRSRLAGRSRPGEPEAIARAGPEALARFHRRWYTPGRLLLVAVGDVDPGRLAADLDRHFGDLAREERPDPPLALDVEPGPRAAVHRDAALPVASVRLRSVRPRPAGPDTRERRVAHLLARLAHDALTRRLRTLAREPGAPHTDGVAALGTLLPGLATATVAVSGPPARWAALLALAERELRRALLHGFTAAEVASGAARMRNAFAEVARAAPTLDSPAIADRLMDDLLDGRTPLHPDDERRLAEAAAARAAGGGLREALRARWRNGAWRVFVAGDLPPGADAAAVLGALASSAREPVAAPRERAPGAFAYPPAPRPAQPRGRSVVRGIGALRLDYANGVRASVLPTGLERNAVLVRVRIPGGAASAPPGRRGLAALAEAAFVAGGLEAHPLADLATLYAGRTVGGAFRVEPGAFVLEATTSPAALLDQLAVLAAFVRAPGLREEGLRVARGALAARAGRARHTLDGTLADRVAPHLRGDDPRLALPGARELERIRRADLVRWLRPALAGGPLDVVVVGDVLPGAAEAAIGRTFGRLAPRGPAPATRRVRIRAPEPPAQATFDYEPGDADGTARAAAVVAWPAPGPDAGAGTGVRLEALAAWLREALREALRERDGLAYEVGAAYRTVPGAGDFGLVTAYAVVDPPRLDEVLARIATLAAALGESPPGGDDFAALRAGLVAHHAALGERNRFWLDVLSGGDDEPWRLAGAGALRAAQALDAAGLAGAARELLRPGRAIRVRVVPAGAPPSP